MNVVITFLVLPYSLKYFQVQIQLVQSRNYAADSWTEKALFGEGLGGVFGGNWEWKNVNLVFPRSLSLI